MIPIGDEIGTVRPPVMTITLLLVMGGVWVFVQGAGVDTTQLATTVCNYGMVAGEITHRARLGEAVPLGQGMACVVDNDWINKFTPLTSMFLHGSWLHILGNALFFWVFGNNVEDSMGRWRFLAFYLICGLAAAATQIASDPASPVPTVGASGAISGVMGAYLVLYPRVRVRMFFLLFVLAIPAWMVLLYWFFIQLFSALPTLSRLRPDVSGGVAVWAHVGGFLTGLILIRWFVKPELYEQRLTESQTHRAVGA